MAPVLGRGSGSRSSQLRDSGVAPEWQPGGGNVEELPRRKVTGMQRRHLSAVLAAVAGLGIVGLLTGPARAAATQTPSSRSAARTPGDRRGDRRNSHGPSDEHGSFWAGGTVTAVDASAGTVTITRLRKDDTAETISVAGDAAITIDKLSGTLAGLPVGARALITGTVGPGSTGVRTVTRIDAATSWPLRLDGAVVSVGDGTLTLNERDKTTITVSVAGGVQVTLDGRASSPAALPVGTRVWVEGTATATGRTVTKVAARTASSEPRGTGHAEAGVERRTAGRK
jgi:hypothetical protein